MISLVAQRARRVAWLVLPLVLVIHLGPVALAKEKREAELPPQYRQWLEAVALLISAEERDAFLDLEKDYQRDAFIERFWKIRDPYPDTARNEMRENWENRMEEALLVFGSLTEDRARMFLMNGPPDSALQVDCTNVLWPLEIWFYDGSDRVHEEFFLLFYQRYGMGPKVLWYPAQGMDEILTQQAALGGQVPVRQILSCRDGDYVLRVLRYLSQRNGMDFEFLMARIQKPVENPSSEWLGTFSAYSTDLPQDAKTLPAELRLAFPHRHQSRTVMEATVEVASHEAGVGDLAGNRTYNFFLTGEVLNNGKLFENFRYKFDFAVGEVTGETIPMVFQRRLRPGSYNLLLKLEDLNSKRFYREEREITVPQVDRGPVADHDPETRKILDKANAAVTGDRPTVEIVAPQETMLAGMVRFEALTTGPEISEIRFALDGRAVLTKRKPPYSVELDLGVIPRTRTLRVSTHDASGAELAADELAINPGTHRFAVHLIEPRRNATYADHVQAEASVSTPENGVLDRLEFYLNENLVATLYQPPFSQRIEIGAGKELAYVRAVGYLADGNSTEDLVFINAPDYLEEIEVEFVELYTTVLDRQGRPVQGLKKEDFRVLEDGVEQQVVRFETVNNLPIHTEIMLDVSASMEENLPKTQQAALHFFQQTVTAKDRASIITFNDHPNLAVKFTNDLQNLAGGLAGLKAERGTALYDSLVFALYHLNGIRGQRAILLLSDGKDESSRFSFENTLTYARRAGVVIYAIGLNITGKSEGARKKLSQLADETGGRSFFIKGVDELQTIYDLIQEDLRSRYLIAYQSTNTTNNGKFRSVDVFVKRPGSEVKTLRGYFP